MFTIAQNKSIRIDKLFLRAASRLASLTVLLALAVSCIGTSNVPVIYHLPQSGVAYNLTGNGGKTIFQPSVEFPDGLPAKSSVVIRLNGAEITDDFNDWGSGLANHARVTQTINSTNTPLIWGALRDGRNTFQVLEPNKQLISFDIDIASARVHIVGVDDGWTGYKNQPKRGNVIVGGYLEGEDYSTIQSMNVQVFGINASGDTYALTGNGTNMSASMGTTVNQGSYYLSLGSDQPNTVIKSVDLGGFENELRLHARYPFTSNVNDASGSGLHLSGSGGSISADGLTLTNASSYTSASTAALNSDYHTISFYLRFNAGHDGNWRKIFGYNAGGSDRSPGIWRTPAGNKIHWRYDPTNTGSSENFTYTEGQFYHVEGIKQGSNFLLYVDDVLVDSGTVSNPKTAGNAALWFGGANVTLRDFRVYSNQPVTGGAAYEYSFLPPRWTPTGQAGIAAEGSAFNPSNTPEGTQAMFLQNSGTATRQFTIRDDKSYFLRFYAAQRNTNTQRVQVYLDGVLIDTVQPADSNFYLYEYDFGVMGKGIHELEFRGIGGTSGTDNTVFIDDVALWATPLSSYGFAFNAYDGADAKVIRISVTDTEGTATKQWLRSTVPIYDTALRNNGGFSIAFDQIALKSTADFVRQTLEDLVVGHAYGGSNHADDVVAGDGTITVIVHHLSFQNVSVYLQTPVARYENEPMSDPSVANIYVDANLPIQQKDIEAMGCSVSLDRVRFRSGLELYADANKVTQFDFANPAETIDLPGLGLSGSFLSGCNILGAFASLFNGIIADVAGDVVDDMIRGIFQNDLPRLRLATTFGRNQRECDPGEIPFYGDSQCALFGPSYLSLRPEVSDFFSLRNPWVSGHTDWDVRFGVNLGMHMTGEGEKRNPALGSLYAKHIMEAAPLSYSATNNATELKSNVRTMGATLTENWMNQLFLGLWESGILYMDFDFQDIPDDMDPLLDNVGFQFASAQPWEFDLLPQDDPKGDVLLTIPDLTIAFIGDVYYPEYIPEYTFAYMLADLQLYLDLSIAPGEGALRIESASAIEVTVQSIYSDWDGTTEDQMINLFDMALTFLTGSGAWDIPFPEILGSNVEFGDLWSDDQQLAVTIDVYNPDIYPMGPGSKQTQIYAWNGSQSNGSYASLENRIDDVAGNSFHFTARARNQTRDCLSSNQWGCTSYSAYYWTEPAFNWGFGFKTIRLQEVTNIGIDRRNDCCNTRADGIRLQLLNNGSVVWQTNTSGSGTGIMNIAVPNVLADEYRFWALRDTSNPTYNCSGSGCWTSGGDALGRVGDGGKTMNFSEVIITTAN